MAPASNGKQARVVAVGAVYLDVVCDDFPYGDGLVPEREVVGSGYQLLPGGSATNFACTTARLDLPTTLVGKIGNDIPGRMLRTLVGEAGVDLRPVVDPDLQTNLGLNFNGEAGTVFTAVGTANQSLTADDVVPVLLELLDTCTHLYLGGCMKLTGLLPALPDLATEAQRQGVTVIVDHGRLFDTLSDDNRRLVRQLCQVADYYVPSVDEFRELWDQPTVEEALAVVQSQSDATVVVKDGPNGVRGVTAETSVTAPAYAVNADNLVGAGDGFNAGLIRALVDGLPLQECLDYGCATAALKISQRQLPTQEDVATLRATR